VGTVLRTEQSYQPVTMPAKESDAIEVSVVMPCLNEAETLESCIGKAQRALREGNMAGEVVVADNGSTDGSVEIAQRMGARVVNVQAKGYGNALMGGIADAHGKYIVMGDRAVAGRRRCGDGKPVSGRNSERCHAGAASVLRKPVADTDWTFIFPQSGGRFLLRPAGIPQGCL